MAAVLTETAPAKINLSLRVLGQRADGYHLLESLVVFADLADTLTFEPGGETALATGGPFAAASGPLDGNLVLKAVAALRARVPGLKAGRFVLQKNIPVAAGLGGGSADAAAALRLLARANGLNLDDARLAASAPAIGADVPVCLESRARIMRGVGEELLDALDFSDFAAVLVNPRVPLSTREVFAGLAGRISGKPLLQDVPRERETLLAWLAVNGNDLTQPAIACVPVIADVLQALGSMPGARLARMSGSGPTCFALFNAADEATAAARRIQAEDKDWWVHTAMLSAKGVRP